MGKRFKSYCLIMVSMIMLTALVIPHHHHGDRMCLKPIQEMSPEKDCSDNHNPNGHAHDDFCKISCATHIVLNKVDCNRNLLPGYSLITLVFDLVNDLLLPGEADSELAQESYYLEKLYPQCLATVCGLRAPPYTIFHYRLG